MNIYIISPNTVWGGAATANMSIAQMLSKGHNVYYNDEYNNVDIEGVTYDPYPTHQSKNSKELIRHLKERGINAVIWGIVMNIPYYREATRLLNAEGITQCALFHSLSVTKNIKGRIMDWMIAKSLKYVDHLVFVSKYTDISWSKYKSIRSHSNHHVIYNPIDNNNNSATRENRSRIGYVGRFSLEKRPEIFAKLSTQNDNNTYIAWGEGALLNDLKERYPKVLFKGQSSSQKEIYESFDILVMTSEFENCPMVILEAWKHGIPCVVPKVGGIPEIVKNEITGKLYEDYSIETISSYITDIQNDYEKYCSNCLAEIKNFSYEKLYDSWHRILNKQ